MKGSRLVPRPFIWGPKRLTLREALRTLERLSVSSNKKAFNQRSGGTRWSWRAKKLHGDVSKTIQALHAGPYRPDTLELDRRFAAIVQGARPKLWHEQRRERKISFPALCDATRAKLRRTLSREPTPAELGEALCDDSAVRAALHWHYSPELLVVLLNQVLDATSPLDLAEGSPLGSLIRRSQRAAPAPWRSLVRFIKVRRSQLRKRRS